MNIGRDIFARLISWIARSMVICEIVFASKCSFYKVRMTIYCVVCRQNVPQHMTTMWILMPVQGQPLGAVLQNRCSTRPFPAGKTNIYFDWAFMQFSFINMSCSAILLHKTELLYKFKIQSVLFYKHFFQLEQGALQLSLI